MCYTGVVNITQRKSAVNTYKHSGSLGDLIYGLPIAQHTGGGKFYLHLNQLNWIGQHFYGAAPNVAHQGRMDMNDFNFLKDFMLAQNYIDSFEVLDPKVHEITHNLDRFRVPFVNHPGNYVDIYADVFGIQDPNIRRLLRQTPWLTTTNPQKLEGVSVVVNRTPRWVPPGRNPLYDQWKADGLDQESVFVGLPKEYDDFVKMSGWENCRYIPTKTLNEVANIIDGVGSFIGNQSVALSLAIGLGVEFWCEGRRDLPIERNECYFPEQPNGHYF